MNRLHRYKTPLLSTILVAVFLIVPQVAFAQAVEGFFQEILWSILITITGSILYICATMFDFAVNTFVIGFGNLYLGSGVGAAVDRIWFILRDFINMFFIFGLVYIGFKMILDVDNSNTRRWLVNLIIAAILINFSLLITKTVVDFSNQIATQVAINGFPEGKEVDSKWGGANGQPGKVWQVDLASYTISLMGIRDLMNCKAAGTTGACAGGWGYIFGTAIFFLVTAFVLAAGAFMLMIRFVALTFFLLVSPFMFISWILPPVSDTMNKYWKAFLGRAFFAPVYFLFLYFSLETLNGLQQSMGISDKGGAWAKTFSAPVDGSTPIDSTVSTLPFFFVICGFMIGSLMIAKKLGADGADKALDYGKSLKNKAISYSKRGAGAATFGVAGAVGRNSLGRGMHALTQNDKFKNLAARSALGSAAYKVAEHGSKASFDARRVAGAGNALGIGEGKKGGFKQRVDDAVKRDKERAKNMGTVALDSPEGKARVEEIERQKKDAAQRERGLAEGGKEGYNEALRTGASAYNDETTNREKALDADESDFNAKDSAGLLTDKDKAEHQARINAQREDIAKRREAAEALGRTTVMKNQSIAANNALNTYFGSDAAEKTRLRDEAEKAKAAWDKQIEDENSAFDQRATAAIASDTNAKKEAEGAVKYSRQIDFMQRRARSQKRWSSIPGLSAAGAAGGLVGGLAAGAVGTGALVGYSQAGSNSYVLKEVVKSLEKEYGKNGVKKLDSEATEASDKKLTDAVEKAVKAASGK